MYVSLDCLAGLLVKDVGFESGNITTQLLVICCAVSFNLHLKRHGISEVTKNVC
jgi:hypothetical protein